MSFCFVLFWYNADEKLWERNSCLYQLGYGWFEVTGYTEDLGEGFACCHSKLLTAGQFVHGDRQRCKEPAQHDR